MHEFPIIELGGLSFDLSSIIAIVVSTIICMVLGVLATRKLSVANPSKMQNFMEWTLEFVHNTVASTMPLEKAKKFITLAATLIMFIFVSNLLGLPFGVTFDAHHEVKWGNVVVVSQELVDEKGGAAHIAFWKSPTADIAVTSGLALIVFFLIHVLGIKMNAKHYFKHYFHPYPIFFPLNLIEQVARPVTLALRLYANIFAGEVLISTILMLKWVGIPLLAVWQGFSIFVGAIQAFLFTVLTMVYIAQAVVHEEHEAH
ncbi:F0F1 ATP synthase subunit A [Paenibacillus sp. GCM10012307]|uniref:ATP synthase subunit a n=1 Tax=Paenibacillus roseus TaxID=2798579 RepID=A0A934J7L1_9BACL|nr:F0F1 ATP synthase subunit A [Paenibacillus roseus]MBJ6361882.1 F0F1 ATP synthase subunit A [Paenibacillus roseus]